MRGLLTILGGIVALDAAMVAGFAAVKSLRRRRGARDIRDLEALWVLEAPPHVSPLPERRTLDRGGARTSLSVGQEQGPPPVDLGSPSSASSAERRRSLRRRVVGLVLAVVMVLAGTALASPAAREALQAAFRHVTQGLAPESVAPDEARATVGHRSAQIPPTSSTRGRDPRHPHPPSLGSRRPANTATYMRGAMRGAPTRKAPPVSSPVTDPSSDVDLAGPTTVTATGVSPTQIELTWTDVTDETGYRVEGSPDGTTGWVMIATPGQDVTSFSFTGLLPGTTYYYRVFATNGSGDSAPSDVVSGTTGVDLAGPTTVTAVAVSSTQIDLTWTDVTDETGYRVEGSPDGDTGWVTLATTGQDVTTHTDADLLPGATYYYRVFATNDGGDSVPSDVASATTKVEAASPTALKTVHGSTQIDLMWTDVSNETGYRIERSSDGTNGWVTLATTGQDVTTYIDADLLPGATYYYRVFATNAGGDSGPSDVVKDTTLDDRLAG